MGHCTSCSQPETFFLLSPVMVKSVCFPGLAPSVCKFSSLIPDVSLLVHTKARSALAHSIPMLPGGPAYLGGGLINAPPPLPQNSTACRALKTPPICANGRAQPLDQSSSGQCGAESRGLRPCREFGSAVVPEELPGLGTRKASGVVEPGENRMAVVEPLCYLQTPLQPSSLHKAACL